MHQILLIDDDLELGPPLTSYLGRFDLTLTHALKPSDGLELLRRLAFDAVILDVMLPEMDGFDVCRTIRKENDLPIVMLTARGELMDRVVGLEIGADDYVPKPFEPRELVARIQTLLRRRKADRQLNGKDRGVLTFDGLLIDLSKRRVSTLEKTIELTGTEYELLLILAKNPGKVYSRDDILSHLHGHEAELITRAVDVLVSRLRKKLEPLDCIKTLRNAGYAFALPIAE